MAAGKNPTSAFHCLVNGSAYISVFSCFGMMQKHALSYDSPLYGRRTSQLRLAPLPFTEIYAVQKMPFEQAVKQCAVTGGVPRYLEFFEDGRELEEQLKAAVLSPNGFLYKEPYFLLKSELPGVSSVSAHINMYMEAQHPSMA